MKHHNYYIYITTNPAVTVLYTGVTNNLALRIGEHYLNRGNPKSFASKYYCYNLIYYEFYNYVRDAIAREAEIKGWSKQKKLALIKEQNPKLKFYNAGIYGHWPPSPDSEIRHSNF